MQEFRSAVDGNAYVIITKEALIKFQKNTPNPNSVWEAASLLSEALHSDEEDKMGRAWRRVRDLVHQAAAKHVGLEPDEVSDLEDEDPQSVRVQLYWMTYSTLLSQTFTCMAQRETHIREMPLR